VAAYEAANRSSIQANLARQASELAALSKQEETSRQQREQARLQAIKEAEEEAYERERQKTDLIRDLASSEGSAEKILARNKAAALKRSSARRFTEEHQNNRMLTSGGLLSLKMEDVDAEEEGPFDPLDGQGEESSLYTVHQNYDDAYVSLFDRVTNSSWLDQVKNDPVVLAGGFIVHDVYKRGLFEAYAGLGCILSDELVAIESA
jgi:CDK-activating kinase assembly factor MAT1